MNEHGYIHSVTKYLKPAFSWKIHDEYAGGVPDLFFEGQQRDLWIEFKYIKSLPKRDTTLIDFSKPKFLSKLQQDWLERREEKRGDALVIVGSPEGGIILQKFEWLTPITAQQFREKAVKQKDIATTILQMGCKK